jgi:hypothetical protein
MEGQIEGRIRGISCYEGRTFHLTIGAWMFWSMAYLGGVYADGLDHINWISKFT